MFLKESWHGTKQEKTATIALCHLLKMRTGHHVRAVFERKVIVKREDNRDMIGESENGQIVTIGDGPVEIRGTHKKGGITIGVASNELKRFGLNQIKRTRLIKAGADIIIPDFSQYDELLNLLNIK
jgi:hypothetical protein